MMKCDVTVYSLHSTNSQQGTLCLEVKHLLLYFRRLVPVTERELDLHPNGNGNTTLLPKSAKHSHYCSCHYLHRYLLDVVDKIVAGSRRNMIYNLPRRRFTQIKGKITMLLNN
jgi:hypothetical protein